jgi:hypothetical protein
MLVAVIIALAAALIAAFVYFRPRALEGRGAPSKGPSKGSSKNGSSKPKSASADGRFAGVALRPGSPACREARRLAGKIILMHEAPVLPLARCDAARCRCSFEKRSDRREENRRWEDHGVQATITSAVERRRGRDRRGRGRNQSR